MNWLVLTPEKEEKVKLIHELLYSIHMDWSEDSLLYDRYVLARRLCLNLSSCLRKQRDKLILSDKFANKKECLAEYDKYLDGLGRLYDEMNNYNPNGTHDGKFFNDDFPYGYRGMLEFFGIGEEK